MVRLGKLVLLSHTAFVSALLSHAQTGVTATLPNGRAIHPAGNWIAVAPYPFAIAVRPDGAELAVPDWRTRLVCSRCGSPRCRHGGDRGAASVAGAYHSPERRGGKSAGSRRYPAG